MLKKQSLAKSVIDTVNTISPFLVAASSFATFTLTGHILTPAVRSYCILAHSMRFPGCIRLSHSLQSTSHCHEHDRMAHQHVCAGENGNGLQERFVFQSFVSSRRLKGFFVAEELDASIVHRDERADSSPSAIEVKDLNAAWNDGDDRTTLKNVSIR